MRKVKSRKRVEYRSPALPQWTTGSRTLAMVATWFFQPSLTLDEADKLVQKRRAP
jgi:hypothetical protein